MLILQYLGFIIAFHPGINYLNNTDLILLGAAFTAALKLVLEIALLLVFIREKIVLCWNLCDLLNILALKFSYILLLYLVLIHCSLIFSKFKLIFKYFEKINNNFIQKKYKNFYFFFLSQNNSKNSKNIFKKFQN